MKESILMTGARGFIGGHLHAGLRDSFHIVRIVPPGGADETESNTISIDLCDRESVGGAVSSLSNVTFKAVIHLAFMLCRPEDRKSMDYFERNNAITRNMIKLVGALRTGCLINFSSLAVYPVKTGCYHEESVIDMSDNTECLYGLSKFNSEVLFRHFLKDATQVINLRVTQVYGPGMQDDRLVGTMHKELSEHNRITVFGEGRRASNFVHVSDIIEAIKKVIERPQEGTYNLGNHENVTYGSLAEHLVSACGNASSEVNYLSRGTRAEARIVTRRFENTFRYVCTRVDFSFLNDCNQWMDCVKGDSI